MAKEKEIHQEDEIEQTKVMSLSTLSTKIQKVDNEKNKKDTSTKKDVTKHPKNSENVETLKDNSSQIQEENSSKTEKETKVSIEIENTKQDDVNKEESTEHVKLEKKETLKEDTSNTTNAIASDKESDADTKSQELVKEEEFVKQLDGIKLKDNNPSVNVAKSDAKKPKVTLEEKRSAKLSSQMTIEERRALQKKGKLPTTPNGKDEKAKSIGKIAYVLLILSMLLSWFVTYHVYSYFSLGYALSFFIIVHVILAGIFFLSRSKAKVGLGINIGMSILMLLLSLLMFKFNDFTNHIFDNSESEMVMLVAKKDSTIVENDDFTNKKIAFVKSDGDTNTFAKEMLKEAKKETYEEVVYVTHKEAFEALMSNNVDMMIYTSFTRQRLADEDIQSWDEIKVIMQKNRTLKAVAAKETNISTDPFNIYISGVDLTSKNINEKGSSDVNIIMSVNPKTKKLIMQTIPRDTWAGLTCSNNEHTKLTYAGAYGGTDCSIKTIEQYLGIDINYYAKINFQGVIDLVDALGGITVNSDVSFCSMGYCFNAGANTLHGEAALMFSRIRKIFEDGDVERGRHQMEVINAIIRKFNESPSLGSINALLGAVENNFTTNLKEDDIGKGLELFLGMGSSLSNIESFTMEGELVWKTDEVTNEYLYYFIPNDGQVELAKQRIQDVIDGK